jgi:starch synthase
MRIAFVVPEVEGLMKQGGLGVFGRELPLALVEQGHEVYVIMPQYPGMRGESAGTVESFGKSIGLTRHDLDALTVYGIAVPPTEEGLNERLELGRYQMQILEKEARAAAQFAYGAKDLITRLQPDVVHTNDWGTVFLDMVLKLDDRTSDTPVVHTIHNHIHTGIWPFIEKKDYQNRVRIAAKTLGLTATQAETLFRNDAALELDKARQYADISNAVSASEARIANVNIGILNGSNYDPFTLLGLDIRSMDDLLNMKAAAKFKLQTQYGLEQDPDAFLLSYMHRWCQQKMTREVEEFVPLMMTNPRLQFVARGDGHLSMQPDIEEGQERRVSIVRQFVGPEEEALIFLASDGFYMPSLHEPAGYAAMRALAAGAVPIATRAGGLVEFLNEENSFLIKGGWRVEPLFDFNGYHYTPKTDIIIAHQSAINNATHLQGKRDQTGWLDKVEAARNTDLRWDRGNGVGPVHQYIAMYNQAIAAKR